MPRLAKGNGVSSGRSKDGVAFSARPAVVGAPRLASADLMPDGCDFAIPRLDGVPTEQQLWQGEQSAARLAQSFLEANIAEADDWNVANRSPFQFLKTGLERWLNAHGAPVIRQQFFVDLLVST